MLGAQDEIVVPAGESVRATLLKLGIKPELVAMVTVAGELQDKDYVIREGDTVRLMAVVGGG